LGQRVISIIETNEEARDLFNKLRKEVKILNGNPSKGYILQRGYVGFVYAALLGHDPTKRLEKYVDLMTERLHKNQYAASCPEVINVIFKESFE